MRAVALVVRVAPHFGYQIPPVEVLRINSTQVRCPKTEAQIYLIGRFLNKEASGSSPPHRKNSFSESRTHVYRCLRSHTDCLKGSQLVLCPTMACASEREGLRPLDGT